MISGILIPKQIVTGETARIKSMNYQYKNIFVDYSLMTAYIRELMYAMFRLSNLFKVLTKGIE